MTTPIKFPLCDFRAFNQSAAGVPATATTTAPTAADPTNTYTNYLVVEDITACLVSGTGTQAPVPVTLVDGTGSTPIVWGGLLGGQSNNAAVIIQQFLNIKCSSGFATLAFGTGLSTTGQTSVAFGGYYAGPGSN